MPRRNPFTLRRLVISVLLAGAVVAFGFAFSMHEDAPPVRTLDAAVRAVEPAPGTQRARQTTVFFELDAGYAGTFETIDGRVIPEDQVDVIEGLNRYSFTPGEGKEIRTFSPGRNCATALLWPQDDRDSARRYTWCYSLH